MRKILETVRLCRAAQYVRMSANQQRYSIENQKDLIAIYAAAHGYEIVKTYTDAGRSGLSLKGRAGLRQLLADVLGPARGFDAVLVYDVSRWGRFQDTDQAAHYEFLCRQAKVKIVYCQEVFEDDASASASILKLLKRVMAKEYSRELSERISRAQLRLAALGYNMGGIPAYGFRRELRDERGKRRMLLEAGEQKATQTDRVVLVPGSEGEIAIVNRIFDLYANRGMTFEGIVRTLTAEGIPGGRGAWSPARVRTVLRSELCIGIYAYNRSTRKLQTRPTPNPKELWIRTKVMEPVVPVELFHKAQRRLAKKRPARHSDEWLLERLQLLLEEKGRLSEKIVQNSPLTPHHSTYQHHFGSLERAFELVGYVKPQWVRDRYKRRPMTDEQIFERLKQLNERGGWVTERTIDAEPSLPCASLLRRRFGSLAAALRLAGLPIATQSQKVLYMKFQKRISGHDPARSPAPDIGDAAMNRDEFIAGLKRLLDAHGYLSSALIHRDDLLPTTSVLIREFGSLLSAYELAGWKRTRGEIMREAVARNTARLRVPISAQYEARAEA